MSKCGPLCLILHLIISMIKQIVFKKGHTNFQFTTMSGGDFGTVDIMPYMLITCLQRMDMDPWLITHKIQCLVFAPLTMTVTTTIAAQLMNVTSVIAHLKYLTVVIAIKPRLKLRFVPDLFLGIDLGS